jgi:hypothetical protein
MASGLATLTRITNTLAHAPTMIHRFRALAALVALSFTFTTVGARAEDAVKLPPKDRFHLFLLVGQSNMAGRGKVEPADQTPHARVLMLDKSGAWVPAVDPIHFDKPAAGVGLGKTFGTLIAEANPGITVGLIPCAVGGSPIDVWKPGVFYPATKCHPWDDAMQRAHLALQSGTLKGILWHQGESDCKDALAGAYEEKLRDLVVRLRAELAAPEVPFILGQLGQYPDVPWTEGRHVVDRAHRELPGKLGHVAFVKSDGLVHGGDKIHFDAGSAREFGKRYAEAFLKMTAGDAKR